MSLGHTMTWVEHNTLTHWKCYGKWAKFQQDGRLIAHACYTLSFILKEIQMFRENWLCTYIVHLHDCSLTSQQRLVDELKDQFVESYIMLTMFSDSKCSLLAKNLWISPIVTCVDNLMNFFCSGYKEKQAHTVAYSCIYLMYMCKYNLSKHTIYMYM